MKITVCDFCDRPIGEQDFDHNGHSYRFAVLRKNRVIDPKYVRLDVCCHCAVKYAKMAAQKMAERTGNVAQQAKGCQPARSSE